MEHSPELPPSRGEVAPGAQARPQPAQPDPLAPLPQAEAHYRSLFMVMEQAFCVIAKVATAPGQPSDYRYVATNPAFARQSGLTDVIGQTLRQVVPGVELRIVAVYDEAVASGTPRHFEEYVADLDVWIAAEVLPDVQPGHLAVLFSNVTARHQAAQTLRESAARQTYLLALSDALRPVQTAGAVQAAVARMALHHFRADRCCYGELDGDAVTIWQDAARPGLPPVAAVHGLSAMPLCRAALQKSRPVAVADVDASPVLDEGFRQLCRNEHIRACLAVPVAHHGGRVGILCLAQSSPREWTPLEVALVQETAERAWVALERANAEKTLRRSEEEFRSLVTATSDTVYRMSPDWHQMHLMLGKNFLADTDSSSGTWLEHYIPVADQPLVQATIEAAIQAKAIFELEHRVIQANGQVGWVYSRAIPVLDAQGAIVEWLGAAQDVTARKQAEVQLQGFNAQLEGQVAERTQALQESRDLLHTIIETQTASLCAFKALRNEQGLLVDLEFLFANAVAYNLAQGRLLVGQRCLALFPEIVGMGLWDNFRQVIETGTLVARELQFASIRSGLAGWAHVIITRLGDGLLVCSEDITARKLAEQERTKVLRLLEQSEEVASMGSWDYELATGILTWSDGMYRLFGLDPATPVAPSYYHQAALPDDQPIAERLAGYLLAGAGSFEETLRLQVGNQVKTVRVKGMVLPSKQGQPVRVLGVDLDISDVRRLEAENLALHLDQQKALLLAILHAQETERNRIAESLHNGLGQLLYATKLQLSQLDVPALHEQPALNSVRGYVDHLLSEAVRQTRTLAHELLPAALAKQSLDSALRDICRSLTTPQLRFTCQVWLDAQVLSPQLQTALYRLAQELAHNIAKHSGASQASLEFELLPGWINLRAEDNGHGFDTATTARGLGLRLLHEAVDLLGGTILLDSSPEYGTHIRLRIPIT